MSDNLQTLIDNSKHTVIFTGAGISTESGIPDFATPISNHEYWMEIQKHKYESIGLYEFESSKDMRFEFWRRKFAMEPIYNNAKPNIGHRIIANLVNQGKVSAIITQNIDGLHQASGVPQNRIIELHGNTSYAKCLDCEKHYDLAPIRKDFLAREILPICDECNSEYVITNTILFGQEMPEKEMARAHEETLACDLFIVIGSALMVYPAAGFPLMAIENDAKLVILNRNPTELDEYAALVINSEIGMALENVK